MASKPEKSDEDAIIDAATLLLAKGWDLKSPKGCAIEVVVEDFGSVRETSYTIGNQFYGDPEEAVIECLNGDDDAEAEGG